MENETKKSKLTAKDILAKTGPGIIMAAAAVGTGTVTTSAILGARYEYGMIWMVILAPVSYTHLTLPTIYSV